MLSREPAIKGKSFINLLHECSMIFMIYIFEIELNEYLIRSIVYIILNLLRIVSFIQVNMFKIEFILPIGLRRQPRK